jgi:succinate dehydrogenase hydrophobic anchor subunit
MPSQPPSAELIERLQRRRMGLAFFQGIVFLLWQTMFFRITPKDLDVLHVTNHVSVMAYGIYLVLMMVFLARSGGFGWSREVREVLDDEVTREHRRLAFETGFWAAMTAAFAIFIASLFKPLSEFTAVHGILSSGLAFALLRFAFLERRALAA